MLDGPYEGGFFTGAERIPHIWPIKLVIPRHVDLLFGHNPRSTQNHINVSVPTKVGGVTKNQ